MIRRSHFSPPNPLRKLAVVTCQFGFADFKRPKANCLRFIRQMERRGIPVYGAELVMPGQIPVSAGVRNWTVLQGELDRHVMWQKEALLSIAMSQVPQEYNAIAWIDADLDFDNQHWVTQTEQSLMSYDIVQPWHEAVWTGEDGRAERSHPACAVTGVSREWKGHPGFAWAARREVIERAGGFYKHCILGNADTLMAIAFTDVPVWPRAEEALGSRHDLYYRWRTNLGRVSVGHVYGRVWHEHHGARENRRYNERIDIIRSVDCGSVVEVDASGLLAWTDEATPELKQQVAQYFTGRKEDG